MSKPICVLGHYSIEECRRDVRKEGWMRREKPKPVSECPADCRNCNIEDKPCKSCNEACLPCQDKYDPKAQA